jgi:hypothetical protein
MGGRADRRPPMRRDAARHDFPGSGGARARNDVRTWHRNCTHLMQRAIVGAPRVAAAAKEPRSTSHGFSREAIGDRNEGNRRK